MFFQSLHKLLLSSLRRQLIVGVAVVHALMMALFIADLTRILPANSSRRGREWGCTSPS